MLQRNEVLNEKKLCSYVLLSSKNHYVLKFEVYDPYRRFITYISTY